MDYTIIHEEKYQQFTAKLDNEEEAELAYATPEKGVLNFTHTFVPESYRGKGLAQQLIKHGLDYVREKEFKVIASCTAVQKYLKQHSEYEDLLQ
ncbi:GNAT family N-acetyltransferase [Pontibacter rugosus]|uniref:GNAT family N-acetyltransferase n=1 Tax=Pontibacter rugosus TaxID=1745966 RepID=A0ABW3SME3_9BACT